MPVRAVLADDDELRRSALRAELDRHGHDVTEASTGGEVLSLAAAEPSLVVLSWTVGPDSGIELCRGLRSERLHDEQVVVLVGDPGELDVREAISAGATDVWPVRVSERPSELNLRVSLAEHYARLQAENVRVGGEFALMRQALDLTGTGFVLTDPRLHDNPIVYANSSFYEMTGYPPEDVLGRNCRFLQGAGTDPDEIARVADAVAARVPVTVELLNRRKDGTAFYNEVHIAPVHDERGQVVRFVGVQVDVTSYRTQEARMATEQRARRRAEAQQRRSAFLAAASPTLDAQLDLQATLDSLAALTVPRLADLCVVDAVRGGDVQRVAARAADRELELLVNGLPRRWSRDPEGERPLARVLRTGRAEIVDETGGPVVENALHEVLELRGGDPATRHWMLVPLRARGRSTGVLVLALLGDERRFGAEDLRLGEDLALRAGLALDNARLYEEQVEVARTLQSSFLPQALPEVHGLELAGRYRPAEAAIDIGGDFYDVLPIAGGGAALTVGDVTGKGAGAASLTSLARHTLRVARLYEDEPEGVLSTLNRVLMEERNHRGRYCTAVAVDLRPSQAGGLDVATVCAGHPAPYLLRADGSVEVVGDRGTILGWVDDPRLPRATAHLAPGDTLICFTDGVSAGDAGGPLSDEDLRRELRRWGDREVDVLAEQLQLAALRAQLGRPADDVVIVVARAT